MSVFLRFEEASGKKWANATLAVTPSGFTIETYVVADRFSITAVAAYDIGVDFVLWANDAARNWTGVVTFIFTNPSRATGRLGLALIASVSTLWTVDAGGNFGTLLNVATGTASTIPQGTVGALGTVDQQMSVSGFIGWDRSVGASSRTGSYIAGSGTRAQRTPTVTAPITELIGFALSDALRIASQPRRAWVFQLHDGGIFRLLDLGEVTYTRNRNIYSVSFDAAG